MPPRAKTTRKKDEETGKRYPLNMRTTFQMRQLLESEGQRTGRSLAQVAEHAIERSFHASKLIREEIFGSGREFNLTTAIFASMRTAGGAGENEDWTRDPDAYREAMVAVLETMITHAPNSGNLTGQEILLMLDSAKSRIASKLINRGRMT
jgi:hypothetical protein